MVFPLKKDGKLELKIIKDDYEILISYSKNIKKLEFVLIFRMKMKKYKNQKIFKKYY